MSDEASDTKRDAIRFCVGPWNGRYSSVWRIWGNKKDDVYLAVRVLAEHLKVSLHQSGRFRIAFTDKYEQKMVAGGKNANVDRAILKWDKIPVAEKQIMQALDIHFPLSALSTSREPDTTAKKQIVLVRPDAAMVEGNDSVTLKVLYHKLHPDGVPFRRALVQRKIFPIWWRSLDSTEFVTFAFQYTKQLPINYDKEDQKKLGPAFFRYFQKRQKKVGEEINNLSLLMCRDGKPPTVYNVGPLTVRWASEKHFSVEFVH
jgi:hypothetical protein